MKRMEDDLGVWLEEESRLHYPLLNGSRKNTFANGGAEE